ncbi:amidohydrolase [Fodinibius roseus]|nr:amidohydrolase [Fodinibius roseus]
MYKFQWVFFISMFLFFGACSSGPPADLVVQNGKILTVDSSFSQVEAVAIRGGEFVAVGDNGDVEDFIGGQTRVIDAAGKTVVPGLIASHTHAISVVRREYATPYPFEQHGSIADIQQWLREQAEQTPQGQWIQLPRTDVTRIEEGRIPTPQELTEAAPDHPAVFNWQFASRQVQVLNEAALEAAGITSATTAPEGGEIERDSGGAPTGVLENSSELIDEYLYSREIPDKQFYDDLERLLNTYTDVGITSIGERGSNLEGYRAYQKLREENRLPVRATVTMYLESDGSVKETEEFIRSLPVDYGDGDEHVRVGPLKIRVDGGILYGSAYMRAPYGEEALSFYGFDDPDHRGELLISPDELDNLIHTGHRMGWQLSAHVTGDAGVDAVLDAVEASQEQLPDEELRFNLIHAYFAHPETAERAAALGVGVDTQPAWYYKDGDALADILRPDLMEKFIGLRNWQEGGAIVSINSDHMYGFDPDDSLNPYNPFITMYTAITRRTEGGQVIGPAQQVSREDALRMMTINAAWMSFEEDRKGSIEVGKLGDLAILTDDLMSVEEEAIRDIRAEYTIVGGKVVHGPDTSKPSAQ